LQLVGVQRFMCKNIQKNRESFIFKFSVLRNIEQADKL